LGIFIITFWNILFVDVNNTPNSFDISCFKPGIGALNTLETKGDCNISKEYTVHLLPL
jgi:hypothetical protein